ncbi:MAG: hypothetical protein QOE77_2238 [Blastocatellia bacterium]|jgi:WD40 repeat protein|nr:hypothetical protein [Blastocatellia bacterium]
MQSAKLKVTPAITKTDANETAPYVGPRPFKEEENQLFFGRMRETDELVSLITAHPVVLLYAPSGAGKSSLVNAGLIPKLKGIKPPNSEEDEEDEEDGEELEVFDVLKPMRVQGQISADLVDSNTNIYMLNALTSCGYENGGVAFAKFLKERPRKMNEFGEPLRRVVIFDQFEELFTAYPERWEDRRKFFEQVSEAFAGNPSKGIEGDPLLRVVFSIREDYIGVLDPYTSLLPECLRTRFRLEQMKEKSALEAIEEPLSQRNISFEGGAAKSLVKNLLKLPQKKKGEVAKYGQYIEPVQLQIVCQSLWEALGPNEKLITQDHVNKYGDLSQVLSDFYERGVKTIARQMDIGQAHLRAWFENTLIVDGSRAPVTQGDNQTGGMPNEVVELLEKKSLLKKEFRGAETFWYELAHDRFIEPIRKSNEKWRARQGIAAQTIQHLESKAWEWQQGRGSLLKREELLAADIFVHGPLKTSKQLDGFVKASKAVAQQKRYKLYKWGAAALAILLIVMTAAIIRVRADYKRAASSYSAMKVRAYLDGDPERGVLLAQRASSEFGRTNDIEEVLRTGIASLSTGTTVLRDLHYGRVNSVAFSPDGKRVVTAGDNKKAYLWTWDTGSPPIELTREKHTMEVMKASFSPDGKRIVTASLDGTSLVFDGFTGALLLTLKGHQEGVIGAVWSPNSQFVATGSNDRTVKIWDTNTGENLGTLSDNTLGVRDLAWSRDGSHIAIETFDHTGRIWRLGTDRPVASGRPIKLDGMTGAASAIAFSPDGKRLITESGAGRATVWDVETGSVVFVLPRNRADNSNQQPDNSNQDRATITSVDISPDNKLAVVADSDGTARVFDIQNKTSRVVSSLRGHTSSIYVAEFDPDSKLVLTGSSDNTARVWDAATGQSLKILSGHSGGVKSAAFSPTNPNIIVTGSDDGSVRVWDTAKSEQVLAKPRGQSSTVSSAAFSPHFDPNPDAQHNSYVVLSGYDGMLRIWDAHNGVTLTPQSYAHYARISYAAFSPDGKSIVTTSVDKTAKVWNLTETGLTTEQSHFTHTDRVYKAAFSPDSNYVVTGSRDGTARVWKAKTGEQVAILDQHKAGETVYSVDYSPDGNSIITAGHDGVVRIWDAHNFALKYERHTDHRDDIYCARYNPTGDLIVTVGVDGIVRIWKASTFTKVADLREHFDEINSAIFSPDGRFLVTASDDHKAIVWDTKTWGLINVLRGQKGKVFTAAFSPDSKYIVTASDDTTVHVYPPEMFAIPIDDLLKLIPQRIPQRELLPKEWEAFKEKAIVGQ